MLIKSGAAPFHFWFPSVAASLSWKNNLLLITLQKIAPIYLIFICSPPFWLLTLLASSGTLLGTLGGINELSLRKILAYSSISHIGWVFASILLQNIIWILYLTTYLGLTTLIILSLKNTKVFFLNEIHSAPNLPEISCNILSLRGIPPFLGFIPKWITIYFLRNVAPGLALLILILNVTSLYFYLKIILLSFLKTTSNPSLKTTNSFSSLSSFMWITFFLTPLVWLIPLLLL